MNTDERMKRFLQRPGLGPVTGLLVELLETHKGETVSDAQMTAHCGRDTSVGGNGYGNLMTAIKYVARTKRVVWCRQAGAGYIKRLTPPERVEHARGQLTRIGRRSRWTSRVLETVDAEDLDGDIAELHAIMAQSRMLESLSSPKARKMLVDHKIAQAPTLSKLLEGFAAAS